MAETDPNYSFVLGSDIDRDGMYLELRNSETELAEVFYSDQSRQMTFTAWKQDLPLPLVEELIDRAKRRLPPSDDQISS